MLRIESESMKYTIHFIAVLLLLSGCKEDCPHSQSASDDPGRDVQQDESVTEVNRPAYHFDLLPKEDAEEVAKGVFLVGWIRASLPGHGSDVQTIAVEMDEPYIYWVQWGLKKDDINFDGYSDIAVCQHGGAKWGKLFWWLYDPETKQFYRNALTEELSRLTFARFWTVPEAKEIKIKDYTGTEPTEYTFRIGEGRLHQVGLAGPRIERAQYWRERGYTFDPNLMTASEMDQKVKDIGMTRQLGGQDSSSAPNSDQ